MSSEQAWGEYGYRLWKSGAIEQFRLARTTESQVRYFHSFYKAPGGSPRVTRENKATDFYEWFPSLEAAEDARLERFARRVESAAHALATAKRSLADAESASRESYYTPFKEASA